MAKRYVGLTLVSGPPNIRNFIKKTTSTFNRGQLVKMTGTPGKIAPILTATTTTSADSGILGVAAKKTTNTTATATVPVHVITSEQVWELHAQKAKKPTSYKYGENYYLAYTSTADFTLSPVKGTGTAKPSIKGTYLNTNTATAEEGAILIAARDDAAKKGSKVLVRFGSKAALETAR
jgi:hypothetical protein